MSEPTLGEIYVLLRQTRDDVRDIREAVFTGHNGQAPILSRLSTIEERTVRVEGRTRAAPVWTGIGGAVGVGLAVLLGYLGIGPGKSGP